MRNKVFVLGALLLVAALSTQCSKSKSDKEMDLLQEYLIENDITTEPTSSGIYYIETLIGTGPEASGGDQCEVKYKGTFLDGEEFDSGVHTFPLGYGRVISGWDEGINYMREGGKATLIIPSTMAYGEYGQNSIPGYTTLIFEVELLSIL